FSDTPRSSRSRTACSCDRSPHIDLAGHGRGDKRRSAFLQPFFCQLHLPHQYVQLSRLFVQMCGYGGLFAQGWNNERNVGNLSLVENWQGCTWRNRPQSPFKTLELIGGETRVNTMLVKLDHGDLLVA